MSGASVSVALSAAVAVAIRGGLPREPEPRNTGCTGHTICNPRHLPDTTPPQAALVAAPAEQEAATATALAELHDEPSPSTQSDTLPLPEHYTAVRQRSETICAELHPEDFVPQPTPDVSPPKWHLAHSTWFFETFVLQPNDESYEPYDDAYAYLFNSYYEAAGPRILRTQRGNMTRPTTAEVYAYRKHVDEAMQDLFSRKGDDPALQRLVTLGLHHEQQHQELLITDILYILGHNPLFPAFAKTSFLDHDAHFAEPLSFAATPVDAWVEMPAGVYEIGHAGEGFSFDNELGRHRVFLEAYRIAPQVVTVAEYLEFMQEGGYEKVECWLSEGWAFAKTLDQQAPLHWHVKDGDWHQYTPAGLCPLILDAPVTHLSYYEADAYARWVGARLPTEFEWEAAHAKLDWGQVWEWTSSAYGPYPGFTTAEGALGEYNGKWMVNQQVLRGASVATSPGHSRATYRNFFHADKRWQYTGLRLARHEYP